MRSAFTVLLLAAFGAAIAAPASARTASRRDVQSDPFYAAWVATLDTQERAAAKLHERPGDTPCGTRDALLDEELAKHHAREDLLSSLARRGFVRTDPPPGVAPWPWTAGASAPPAAPATLDTAAVSVLFNDGHIAYTNRYGQPEVDPVRAARAFYAAHHDEYDLFAVFTNFRSTLVGGTFIAYHMAVANEITGLGYTHWRVDGEDAFGDPTRFTRLPEAGRLQSFLHMNNVEDFPDDPHAIYWRRNSTVTLLGHEAAHRWLARVMVPTPGIGITSILLGRQFSHWSFFFDSQGSALEGNKWDFDGERFGTLDVPFTYGPLDLYLMGMIGPDEIPTGTLWYVDQFSETEPESDPLTGFPFTLGSAPLPGVTCVGGRADVEIQDVIDANGPRFPAYPEAPRTVRIACALIAESPASLLPRHLDRIAVLQGAFATWFADNTRGRGSIDFTLHRVPARLLFTHRPRGDFEDPARAIPVTTEIQLGPASLPTRLEDVHVDILVRVDDGPEQVVPMTATAVGSFAGEIPPQPLGSRVRYVLRAGSNFPGHEARWPETGAFEFRVAADGAGPTLTHVERHQWSRLAEPPLFRTVAFDAHGVASVAIEYRRRGDMVWSSQPLAVQGTTNVWETRVALPGRIGDVVEYRFVAEDIAANPHRTSTPAAGAYTITLQRTTTEGAEFEEPMWPHWSLNYEGPDQWHREIVNPHSGAYKWKIGPANNTVPGVIEPNQDAVLESPVIQVFPDGKLTFWHRYAFLTDEFEPRGYADHGGIVMWQDFMRDGPIDRWGYLEPDNGYTHLMDYTANTPLRGWPVFSGVEPFWVFETFTFPPHVVNRTIRLRLRVVTTEIDNRRPALDGWQVDDITIDPGPPTTAVALTDLAALRAEDGVHLSWRAQDLESGDRFRVEREVDASDFELLVAIAAEIGREGYVFVDTDPAGDRERTYRVTLLRDDVVIAALETRVAAVPFRLALAPNVPNPFNPTTTIRFELARAGTVRLALYDVRGQHVRDLVDGVLAAGPHRVAWDGTDAHGRPAASGVYFDRLTSDGRTLTRRMLLVR